MLEPKVSLGVGLATAALVWGVYQHALPSLTEHRIAAEDNAHAQAAEKTATWTSAAIVSAVSLIARDPSVFILGGAMVIGLAWWHRHADMVNPDVGLAVARSEPPQAYDGDAYDTGNGGM